MARSILKIRHVGPSLPYSDQAEDEILALLEAADDRSDGSDELAAAIRDWPTRYHLAPARSHLLRPFALGAGTRVLEIGAGTGALTRHVAETGAQVVALEGNVKRAEAVALRCAGLGNVEVLCGPLAGLDAAALDGLNGAAGFDLAIVVGVLEYAGAAAGGGATPESFLTQVRALLRPGGALILAIENQLGLRYLLGGPEDHLGQPWSGVLDYPGRPGIRTFARRPLAELLAGAGFTRQRWLYPFPDYKLPRVILGAEVYDEPDAEQLVDQLVRFPSRHDGSGSGRDERRAHRVWLRAGLGPEVAPSFLVLAAVEPAAGEPAAGSPAALEPWLDPSVLAWCFSAERRRGLRRMKVIRRTGGGERDVEARRLDEPAELPSWLEHSAGGRAAWVQGPTLEQLALDACHDGDRERLRAVLGRWVAALEPRTAPARRLDVDLSNFVASENGETTYVDDEWRAVAGIDSEIAALRALWYFGRDLVQNRAAHPWPPATTIDELASLLADLAGLSGDAAALERFRAAEPRFIAAVTGWPEGELASALEKLGETSALPPEDPRLGELAAIHRSKTWRWWMASIRLRRWLGW